jgi:hypothetical protein
MEEREIKLIGRLGFLGEIELKLQLRPQLSPSTKSTFYPSQDAPIAGLDAYELKRWRNTVRTEAGMLMFLIHRTGTFLHWRSARRA